MNGQKKTVIHIPNAEKNQSEEAQYVENQDQVYVEGGITHAIMHREHNIKRTEETERNEITFSIILLP